MLWFASLAWVGLVVWLMPQVWPRVDRYLGILEQRLPVKEDAVAPDPIPTDLLLQARTAYSEKWAQEQALEHFYDLRQRTGSWDGVREAIAAGGL